MNQSALGEMVLHLLPGTIFTILTFEHLLSPFHLLSASWFPDRGTLHRWQLVAAPLTQPTELSLLVFRPHCYNETWFLAHPGLAQGLYY